MKDYLSSPLSPSNKKMSDSQKISPTNTPIRKKLFDIQSPMIHSNNNNMTTPAKGGATSIFKFTSNSLYNNTTVSGSAIKQQLIPSSISKQLQQQQSNLSNSSENILPEDKVPMSVYLRIRPLSEDEVKSKESNCFTVLSPNSVSIKSTRSDSDSNKFSFSSVLPPTTTQPQLFKTITHPLIQSFLNGHNILLLAYGVTNAGKTYTISGSKRNPGVIPRSLELIFKSIPSHCLKKNDPLPNNINNTSNNNNNNTNNSKDMLIDSSDDEYTKVIESSDDDEDSTTNIANKINNTNLMESFSAAASSVATPSKPSTSSNNNEEQPIQMSDQFNYAIWISYYEIHKKNIHDLLDDSPASTKKPQLKIESENSTVNIKGLKEVLVSSVEDARDIIEQGEQNRKVGGTKLNKKSSRSHAVLTIKLFTSPRDRPRNEIHYTQIRCSKLCIIDLAGSERASRSETTGERLKEASNINTSLFILGKCIEGLKQQALQQQQQLLNSASKIKRQSVYVNTSNNIIPWRESDLTRVCQEYFVGNGKAAMIVNVSPTNRDSEETLNVLRFSANAKEITTQSKIKPMVNLPPTPMTQKKRKSMEQHHHLNHNQVTSQHQVVNELRKKMHLDSLATMNQLPINSNSNSNNNNNGSGNNFNKIDFISMEKDQLLDQIQLYQKRCSDFEIKFTETEVILREQFKSELIKSYIELESQYKDKLVKQSQLIHDRLQSKLSLIKNVNTNQTSRLNNQISKLESQISNLNDVAVTNANTIAENANQPPPPYSNNKRSDDEWILEITEIQSERDNIQNKLNSITFELDEERQLNANSKERLRQFDIQLEYIELEKQELQLEIESMQEMADSLIKKREFETMQLKELMNSEAQKDRENLQIQHAMETANLNNQLQLEKKEKQQILDEYNKLKKELQQYVQSQQNPGSAIKNINNNQFNHPILANAQFSTPVKLAPVGKFNSKATPSKSLIKNILGAHSNSPFKNANIESSVGGGYKVQLNIPGSPIQLAPGTPNSISSQTPDRPILDPNQYGDSGLLMKEIDDEDYLNITGNGTIDDGDDWLDINVNDDSDSSNKSYTKKPKKTKSVGTLKRIKDKTIAVAMISANIASSALNSSVNNNNITINTTIDKEEKEKEKCERKVVRKTSSSSSLSSSRKSSKQSLTSSITSNSSTNNHKVVNLTPVKSNIISPTSISPSSTILSPISSHHNAPTSPVTVHVASSTRAPIDPPQPTHQPSSLSTTTTTTKTKKTLDSIVSTPKKKIANIFSSKSSKEKSESKEIKEEKLKPEKAITSVRPKRMAALNATCAITGTGTSESAPIELDTTPVKPLRKPPIPAVTKSTTTKKSTTTTTTTAPVKKTTRKIVDDKKNYLEEVDEFEIKPPSETPRKALGLRPRSKIAPVFR